MRHDLKITLHRSFGASVVAILLAASGCGLLTVEPAPSPQTKTPSSHTDLWGAQQYDTFVDPAGCENPKCAPIWNALPGGPDYGDDLALQRLRIEYALYACRALQKLGRPNEVRLRPVAVKYLYEKSALEIKVYQRREDVPLPESYTDPQTYNDLGDLEYPYYDPLGHIVDTMAPASNGKLIAVLDSADDISLSSAPDTDPPDLATNEIFAAESTEALIQTLKVLHGEAIQRLQQFLGVATTFEQTSLSADEGDAIERDVREIAKTFASASCIQDPNQTS